MLPPGKKSHAFAFFSRINLITLLQAEAVPAADLAWSGDGIASTVTARTTNGIASSQLFSLL